MHCHLTPPVLLLVFDFLLIYFYRAICIFCICLTLHWQRSRMQNLQRVCENAGSILAICGLRLTTFLGDCKGPSVVFNTVFWFSISRQISVELHLVSCAGSWRKKEIRKEVTAVKCKAFCSSTIKITPALTAVIILLECRYFQRWQHSNEHRWLERPNDIAWPLW